MTKIIQCKFCVTKVIPIESLDKFHDAYACISCGKITIIEIVPTEFRDYRKWKDQMSDWSYRKNLK